MTSFADRVGMASLGRRTVAAVGGIRGRRLALLALVFAAAFGLRLYHIDQPPLEFHAARQYRSLIIARGLYVRAGGDLPGWERRVAELSMERQGILEPPLMELAAAGGYLIAGSEQPWIPRVLSSAAWLMGGAFLYRIGRRVADQDVALIATAFYLFLPFSVVASRAFQPDPAMVALMLVALWAILRHHDEPSGRSLAVAIAAGAIAFVWLPRAAPVVLAVFVSLAIQRHGPRAIGVRSPGWARDSLAFAVPSAIPAAIVYAVAILSGAFLTQNVGTIFRPDLWLSSVVWRGWLASVDAAVGLPPLFGALLGVFLFARGTPRAFVLGLWAGYVLFALAFDYAASVHDYYHLQLVPIVGLCAAPIIALALRQGARLYPEVQWRATTWAILAVALLVTAVFARGRLENPGWQEQVASRQAIGEAVGHSTRTVYLAGDYGAPLEYHGLLAGRAWPLSSDIEWERLTGYAPITAEARFARDFAADRPEFFVVEDDNELAGQPDLARFLEAFPLLAEGDGYRVYDLRGQSP